MHSYSVHLPLNYIMLSISIMYLTIHGLEFWLMCCHILHTLSIIFPINWMPSFPTQTLHQEYNSAVFISVIKKVATQVYLKVGRFWYLVWLIIFPYMYLSISNHVLVSYMTSFLAFILVTSSYLLILWLLPHKQINMTFYYVDVCIQKLKIFELTHAYNLYHIRWYAFK
jgi:hypothetical protein